MSSLQLMPLLIWFCFDDNKEDNTDLLILIILPNVTTFPQ
jgi:hypothetical protein